MKVSLSHSGLRSSSASSSTLSLKRSHDSSLFSYVLYKVTPSPLPYSFLHCLEVTFLYHTPIHIQVKHKLHLNLYCNKKSRKIQQLGLTQRKKCTTRPGLVVHFDAYCLDSPIPSTLMMNLVFPVLSPEIPPKL